MTDPRLSEELAKVRGTPNTTKLSGYVRDNIEWFREQRRQHVTWGDLVRTLGNIGIRDANGDVPRTATLLECVKRVERQLKRERERERSGRVGRPSLRPSSQAEPRHSSDIFNRKEQ